MVSLVLLLVIEMGKITQSGGGERRHTHFKTGCFFVRISDEVRDFSSSMVKTKKIRSNLYAAQRFFFNFSPQLSLNYV